LAKDDKGLAMTDEERQQIVTAIYEGLAPHFELLKSQLATQEFVRDEIEEHSAKDPNPHKRCDMVIKHDQGASKLLWILITTLTGIALVAIFGGKL